MAYMEVMRKEYQALSQPLCEGFTSVYALNPQAATGMHRHLSPNEFGDHQHEHAQRPRILVAGDPRTGALKLPQSIFHCLGSLNLGQAFTHCLSPLCCSQLRSITGPPQPITHCLCALPRFLCCTSQVQLVQRLVEVQVLQPVLHSPSSCLRTQFGSFRRFDEALAVVAPAGSLRQMQRVPRPGHVHKVHVLKRRHPTPIRHLACPCAGMLGDFRNTCWRTNALLATPEL
eukprot:2697216-Rhodomonas_salina.1